MKEDLRTILAEEVAAIEAEGFTVEFKDWCEDGETPGFLGMFAGLTLPHRKAVKVRTHGFSVEEIRAVLKHELEHVQGKEYGTDCPEHGLKCGGTRNTLDILGGSRRKK